MRRAIALAAALLSACAPRPAPPSQSLRLLDLKVLEPMPYVESPMFSAHYYVFRDHPGRAWGPGKVLAAHWRKELGFESTLEGLGAAGGGALAVERPKKGGASVVLRLGSDGAVASSAPFSGGFDEFRVLRANGRALFASRYGLSVTVADPETGGLWSPPGEVGCIAAADLDGDGSDELLTHARAGEVSAYDAAGRRLWHRSGLPEPHETTGGRLEGIGPAVVLRGGRFGDRLTVIDGRGRVALSTPAAYSEALFMAVASGGLATVGHAYPEERDFLAFGPAGGAPRWRVDLGWTAVTALAAADLDGDGRDELALGTVNGWVLVYSDEGKLLSEKNFMGEVSHLVAADLAGGGRQFLVALRGIPPQIFGVGVVPDPGPWKQ